MCCSDSDENVQALTSVGIRSLTDKFCNLTGVTHISEYLTQHTDVRHSVHRSCWLKTVNQACRAHKAKTAGRDSAKVSTRSVAGAFSFKDVFFCGESVTGYDKADVRQVRIGREFDDSLWKAAKKCNNNNWSLRGA